MKGESEEKMQINNCVPLQEKENLSVITVCLGIISTLIYFANSHGIKNHILFLSDTFRIFMDLIR